MSSEHYGVKLIIIDNSSLTDGENSFDNFIEVANTKNVNKISPDNEFYFKKDSNDDGHIIVLEYNGSQVHGNKQCVISICFTTGKLIKQHVDEAISEDLFTRSSDNIVWYVNMRKKEL